MPDDEQEDVPKTAQLIPASRRPPAVRRQGAVAIGATAVGALALGAIALGAVAIGKAAIGQLNLGRVNARRGEIDDLVITRLTIRELIVECLD
jgi:hypothetical protein